MRSCDNAIAVCSVAAGCFCVFYSQESLHFIQRNLDQTLLLSAASLQHGQLTSQDGGARTPFQGLPIVLVLAHNPQLSDTGLQLLRDDGQALADRWGRGVLNADRQVFLSTDPVKLHLHVRVHVGGRIVY